MPLDRNDFSKRTPVSHPPSSDLSLFFISGSSTLGFLGTSCLFSCVDKKWKMSCGIILVLNFNSRKKNKVYKSCF